MCPGLFFVRRARKECGDKVVSSRAETEAAQKQRRAERRRFRRVRLPSSRRSRKKTRCSPRLRSGRDGRSGRAVRGDGTGRTRLRGSCRAATHERRGSARAEGFRRCRTSRSDDGCAALTGGTAASSKLNSRSPADAVLEGTKRSEYKVSFFPFDPEGFASVGSIVFDENAQTEARSRHAGHVRTPRHLAVANYEEVPYAFRRFPCVSAPSAPPGRSHAGWYRVPFASRCPIRVDVPTTSRASRCGLSPRVLPVGTVARIPRSSRSSRSFPEFHSVIQSEKNRSGIRIAYAITVMQKRNFARISKNKRETGNERCADDAMRTMAIDISTFQNLRARRRGDSRVTRVYIQQPRHHSTDSMRY